MEIKRIPLGSLATNCYLLEDEQAGLCAVIDPAENVDAIRAAMEEDGVTPALILLTHGHFDHVGAVPELHAAFPDAAVYIHSADLAEPGQQLPYKMPYLDGVRTYAEGDVLSFGGLTLQVLHTPGHSAGSVTLKLGEEVLFTGDTLFHYSCGRTDLEGGSDVQMETSLRRLAALPGNPAVLSGHGPTSTLNAERAGNPYLRRLS
ncbi:MAG: MBL fold metallo-hydrolase [Oscillospiraceae bacterium]|nr:MBL fold metallo-hydrolase [Oscillospiraceae bacterium]